MSEGQRVAARYLEQIGERQDRLVRALAWSTIGAALLYLLLHVAVAFIRGTPLLGPASWIAGGLVAIALVCLRLSRRDQATAATITCLAGVTAAVVGMMYLYGGATGPLAPVLVIVPMAASLWGGSRLGRLAAIGMGLLYLPMLILEVTGVVAPAQISDTWLRVGSAASVALSLGVMTALTGEFSSRAETAMGAAESRARELAQVSREAELAAEVERQTREEQERTVTRVRQMVSHYVGVMERVSAGDYDARLELASGQPEDVQSDTERDLQSLGAYLSAMVSTLVSTVRDMEVMKGRYLGAAWSSYAASGDAAAPFHYADGMLRDDALDPSWGRALEQAARSGQLVVQGSRVSLPMVLGGQLIGAMGARLKNRDEWSPEEIALVRAVVDQLVQTMENLRLVDQTQRAAERERMLGRIAESIRQELEIDGVFRTAADEIQRELGLSRVVIRLAKEP